MKKIVTIIGTRPEVIKMSPLLELFSKKFKQKIVHSGQHYDENMNRAIYKQLKLPKVDYYLNVRSGSFSKQASVLMRRIEEVLVKEKPDFVVVQGDTNTSMCGALVSRRLNIKLIHVEAGCRSGNKNAPEEQNRIIIDSLSDVLFCADKKAYKQSLKEGFRKNSILVGSTTFDALERSLKLSKFKLINKFKLTKGSYIVTTLHRAEGMWDKESLIEKLNFLDYMSNFKKVIFPMHPRTKNYIRRHKITIPKNVEVIDPIPYLEFIGLLKNCYLVVTDSGGIQEEAAYFGKPCLILRNETEWTRLVDLKKNFLFKNFNKKNLNLMEKLLIDKEFYKRTSKIKDPESKVGASKEIYKWIRNS